MCGIACYLGNNKDEGLIFGNRARHLLRHRGPDDSGIFADERAMLAHTRLSILDLSVLGHQPMESSCGRYVIAYNGEIYNHLDLRKKYLPNHQFKGHSDTETILEIFSKFKEKVVDDMVGMWAFMIYDKDSKKIFISRSRFGQKPLYVRRLNNAWFLSSEIKPLIREGEHPDYYATALVEYLALGNYGHLGVNTFFKDIKHFPEGSNAWLSCDDQEIDAKKFWVLPEIREKDKLPFDEKVKKGLHDCIVEAVLSQTLSDVPIGITLSGGIDSSIIAGILATYYDKEVHIFTAQSENSNYDETRYVDAVIDKYRNKNVIVHRKNLQELSISQSLEKYIRVQEEPFGDPSIIAHGILMEMAANANIKVVLSGQGADELFFGYNNMLRIILSRQLKELKLGDIYENLNTLKLGKKFFMKTVLGYMFPSLAYNLRLRSRVKRRELLQPWMLADVDNDVISIFKYDSIVNVLRESMYGVHIPHLVQYDDRNSMSFSVEGRMPFLDHRITEYVAHIRPDEFLKNGMRKYILRTACRQYIPELVYNRKDKIGFYTPLVNAVNADKDWVKQKLNNCDLLKTDQMSNLTSLLDAGKINTADALILWKCISIMSWMHEFGVADRHRRQG